MAKALTEGAGVGIEGGHSDEGGEDGDDEGEWKEEKNWSGRRDLNIRPETR